MIKDHLPISFIEKFKHFSMHINELFNIEEIGFSSDKFQLTYHIKINELIEGLTHKFERVYPLKADNFPGHIHLPKLSDEKDNKVIQILIENLTEAISNAVKTNTAENRFQTMIAQSPIPIQILSLDGRITYVNPAWQKLWSVSDEFIKEYILKEYNIFQDGILKLNNMIPLVEKGFKGQLTHIPVIRYDPLLFGREGRVRMVEALIYPLKDNSGNAQEIVIMHSDVTDKEELLSRLTLEKNNLQTIVEFLPAGILFLDKKTYSFTLANKKMDQIQGLSSLGKKFNRSEFPVAFHPDGRQFTYEEWPGIRALEKGEIVTNEDIIFYSKDGRTTFLHSSAAPIKNSNGETLGAIIVAYDVTKLKKYERSAKILSKTTSVLIESLEYETTISKLAEACIPDFTDACLIDLISDDSVKRIVTRHADPKIQQMLEEIAIKYPVVLDSPQPSARVIRTKTPEFVSNIDPDLVTERTYSSDHQKLIMAVGLKSYIAVPLIVRDKLLGSMTLMITSNRERFDETDLGTAMEISRRASLAFMNAQLYKSSQEAIFLRDDFISIASHELKTPITSMKLQLQLAEKMISKDSTSKVHIDYLNEVISLSYNQLNRINLLVNDMLDVSRISSGRLQIHPVETNFSTLVSDTIERLSREFEGLNKLVQLKVEKNIFLRCDAFRIEQVVTNLLSNAIKYGDEKPILVSVFQKNQNAYLTVKDEGIGIDKSDMKRIFERFERAVSSKYISGFGLGLYISRQIIEQHQGTLTVESESREGSTFTVMIPIKNLL